MSRELKLHGLGISLNEVLKNFPEAFHCKFRKCFHTFTRNCLLPRSISAQSCKGLHMLCPQVTSIRFTCVCISVRQDRTVPPSGNISHIFNPVYFIMKSPFQIQKHVFQSYNSTTWHLSNLWSRWVPEKIISISFFLYHFADLSFFYGSPMTLHIKKDMHSMGKCGSA